MAGVLISSYGVPVVLSQTAPEDSITLARLLTSSSLSDGGYIRSTSSDSLRRKAIEKQTRYPDLPDPSRIEAICTLREFDDVFTAPIHGFVDAADYYEQSK